MLNILLISTIYPLPEGNKGTPVCHYFTREWVKMGYNVRVVHIQSTFPHIFYWIARMARSRIASKTGAVVYTHRDSKTIEYEMDNVPVNRMPVYKPIPHGAFSKKSIRNTVKEIIRNNQDNSFKPDVIIGHFPNPQIELLNLLKSEYSQAKTCIVMHGDIEIMQKVYGDNLPQLMKSIDIWGFRSKTVLKEFELAVGKVKNPFFCYSGIPEAYLTKRNTHDYRHPMHSFLYVGLMIDRKYPEKVLDALTQAYPTKDFHLTYIGEGQQLSVIREKMGQFAVRDQVSILGRISRDKIVEEYDKADCMVMISRGEAYGLVYLEAMARGCITIASRHEGFDGVIVDGENGFLCEAGNAEELAIIIMRINAMTADERQAISDRAIETAKRLTDEKAARLYIDDVIARMKQ